MKTRIIQLRFLSRLNSGQAIVLIGLAAIGLLGMMGLAIDGGRLLFLQRDVQNAADAAAIAAARALCTQRNPEPYALAAAAQNGFGNDGHTNWVTVNSPPVNTSFAIGEACEGCYVEVEIKAEIPPTFIGIVYGGELMVTSNAIGACNPDMNAAGNAAPELRAVWAMDDNCPPNSVEISGSSISISGGLHSNGEMKIMPSDGTVIGPASYVLGGGVQDNGKVTYNNGDGAGSDDGQTSTGSCLSTCFSPEGAGGGSNDTYPAQNPYKTDPKTQYPLNHSITDFQPGGPQALLAASKGQYFQWDCSGPAKKFSNWVKDNYVIGTTMRNGIYYANCDITIDKLDNIEGNVTIVSTGQIQVGGDSQNWKPYTQDLLLFTSANTGCQKAIQFSGNSNQWEGNIFSPNGSIKMSAASNSTTRGCLVGQSVELSGSNTAIICEPQASNHVPNPGIWLAK